MKVAPYVRVSTDSQTPDNQLPGITQVYELRCWKLVGVYRKHASARASGRKTELAQCIHDTQHHHFDICSHYIPYGEELIR
jgi:DNA invertase Pin-like site-specific DNA recombinase